MPTAKGALGTMFLPFGPSDFRRLRDQWQILPKTLASMYRSMGLLEDDVDVGSLAAVIYGAQAGWSDRWYPVFSEAWQKGKGQKDEFFACFANLWDAVWEHRHRVVGEAAAVIIGSMLRWLFVLGLAWAFLKWMVPSAYAQAVGATAGASGAGADLARQILTDLYPFLGGGTLLAQGIGALAKFIGITCLTIAIIQTIWTTAITFVEYNDNFESAKQRYSFWMLALRVAICFGALYPLAGGYNLGQHMVVSAGAWGSDQATKAWAGMVNYLTTGGGTSWGNDGSNWVATPAVNMADLERTVVGTALAEACAAGVNDDPSRNQNERVTDPTQTSGSYDHQVMTIFGAWHTDIAGGCGVVTYPNVSANSSDGASTIIQNQKAAYATIRGTIRTAMKQFTDNRITCRDTPTSCKDDVNTQTLTGASSTDNWVVKYKTSINTQMASAMSSVNANAVQSLTANQNTSSWTYAGTFAMALSQLQTSYAGAANAIPKVAPPTMINEDSVKAATEILTASLAMNSSPGSVVLATAKSGSGNTLDALLAQQISPDTFWASFSSMTPLASISSAGTLVLLAGAALKVAQIFAETGPFLKGVASAAEMIADPLLFAGFVMAFIIPALPFIRFVFAIMEWLITFTSTVILTPLLFLQIISAERGGVFMAAKAALWNVASLILRPLLIIIGFCLSIEIISQVIGIVNTQIVPLYKNNNGSGYIFVYFMACVFIYMGICYVVVNSCTRLCEILPHTASHWLGANASGDRDDGAAVGGAMAAVFNRGKNFQNRPKDNNQKGGVK